MGYWTFLVGEDSRRELAMTSAQSGPGVSAPEAYREKLFNLLAGRDPMQILGQTSSILADIVAIHPAALLRARPFEGK